LFAALLGWASWGEVPDRYALLGGGLVIAAGVLALRIQRRPRH
jgi:drug/metabolite transporter (DMT)-like permease